MVDKRSKILKAILFLLFMGSPLVVIWGASYGHYIFTAYREPKLFYIEVFSWALITTFWVLWNSKDNEENRLRRAITDRFFILLVAFLFYLALTAKNALVVKASIYELVQFFSLLNLYVVLVILWQDPKFLKISLLGIVSGLAAATLIGFYQYIIGDIPFLIPLSRYYPYGSTFGYKNPMALAISAQIFLLIALFFTLKPLKSPLFSAILGIVLLGAELFYVSILGSRTSYVALFVSAVTLIVFVGIRAFSKRQYKVFLLGLIVMLVGATVFYVAFKTNKITRYRLQYTLKYLKKPSSYWNSDRGIYLRNSIHMANSRFLGVGIGNWGIAYPFYRKVKPHFLFGKRVQVRRAHNDYAQLLGETGWAGLLLFLMILGWTLYRGSVLVFKMDDNGLAILSTAQLVAFLFLMATDFCIEMPYHKFFLFCIIAMVQSQFLKWSNLATTGQN